MPATTPEQMDQLFAEAMNGGDIDALLALYEPAAPLVTPTGELVADTAARRAFAEPVLAMSPKMAIETTKVVQRDDLALVYSSWTIAATDPTGAPVNMAGNSVVVLRRGDDGNWRFAIDDPGWLPG